MRLNCEYVYILPNQIIGSFLAVQICCSEILISPDLNNNFCTILKKIDDKKLQQRRRMFYRNQMHTCISLYTTLVYLVSFVKIKTKCVETYSILKSWALYLALRGGMLFWDDHMEAASVGEREKVKDTDLEIFKK